jgi:hypothetical protein
MASYRMKTQLQCNEFNAMSRAERKALIDIQQFERCLEPYNSFGEFNPRRLNNLRTRLLKMIDEVTLTRLATYHCNAKQYSPVGECLLGQDSYVKGNELKSSREIAIHIELGKRLPEMLIL